MINTWSELFTAIKIWIETPFERKQKLPEPSEYVAILSRPKPPHADAPKRLDQDVLDLLNSNSGKYWAELHKQELENRSQARLAEDLKRLFHCGACDGVGCDRCSLWPKE